MDLRDVNLVTSSKHGTKNMDEWCSIEVIAVWFYYFDAKW